MKPAAHAGKAREEAPRGDGEPGGVWARIAELRKGGKTQVRYAAPQHEEAERHGRWVAAAVRASSERGAPPEAPEGFQLHVQEGGTLWLLSEHREHRRGAGAVLLRVGPAQPLIVEAPHTFFDQGTLLLARQAFERTRARALVLNTAHRGNLAQGRSEAALEEASRSGALKSDVAHAERSFFQEAHRALSRAVPAPKFVQLHGFRDGLVPADAVVSAAGGRLDVEPLVTRLRELLPRAGIARYGYDTNKLGGTTNVQAQDAKEQGVPFLHLELSHSLRSRLQDQPALRDEVLEAIASTLGT